MNSNPDLTNLLDVDKEDLLFAMKKLSKMIHSDKQFDVDYSNQQPSQHFSLPSKMDPNSMQHTFAMSQKDPYNQVITLQLPF